MEARGAILTVRRRSTARLGLAAMLAVLVTLAAACSSAGADRSSGQASTGPVSRGQATTAPTSSPQQLTVTSTLDGHTTLPVRIHWQATPSMSDASEVEFLIDGKLGWVEHHAPYFYGDDGNWLVTSFLKPGRHTFTVRVVGTGGQMATDAVGAVVSPPPKPPAQLVGVWSRSISGLSQDPGRWHVTINSIGWSFEDSNGGGQNQDVSYPASGKVLIRAAIEEPPFGGYDRGGAFCDKEPDPPGLYTYRVSAGGRTLTLKPVGKDCREAILGGTWSRVNG